MVPIPFLLAKIWEYMILDIWKSLLAISHAQYIVPTDLGPAPEEVLVANLHHVGGAVGVEGGGPLGEHGRHVQDVGVAPADAREQLAVVQEDVPVLWLRLFCIT